MHKRQWLILAMVNVFAPIAAYFEVASGRVSGEMGIFIWLFGAATLSIVVVIASRKRAKALQQKEPDRKIPILYWVAIVFSVAYSFYYYILPLIMKP